jgi:hypothetical protein
MRLRSRVLHFASMSVISQPPWIFGRCSVAISILKIAPCHIKHVNAEDMRWTCEACGGSICARYQIFARKNDCTYWIRNARCIWRVYAILAWLRVTRNAVSQFILIAAPVVDVKWIPSILIWSLKGMSNMVASGFHFATAHWRGCYSLRYHKCRYRDDFP